MNEIIQCLFTKQQTKLGLKILLLLLLTLVNHAQPLDSELVWIGEFFPMQIFLTIAKLKEKYYQSYSVFY